MKRNLPKTRLCKASLDSYPIIQNLARFYVYDLSRFCGFISPDWECPKDGLFKSFDYKSFFEEPTREAFLIKIGNEIAGFILIKREKANYYKLCEFFVLAKFQGHGVAADAAQKLWHLFPATWELTVIPENIVGLKFWRRTIGNFTNKNFTEELALINYDSFQPRRYMFVFESFAQKA
jgi:predicted acetyltransferase